VNTVMLLRLPGTRMIEGPLVRRLRDSAVYQTEVGLYDAPPIEALEWQARLVLDAYLPHYRAAVEAKRQHATRLRAELEPLGFVFQTDTGGHLYTAVGARVPEGVDRDALVAHLAERGINAFTLWGDPLGTSAVAQHLWGTDATALPVTARLAAEYIHFPVTRFLTAEELRRIVTACSEFVGGGQAK
jgi:dTDP-4-amino-4,6-dideoxygalactose transaminase